LRLNLLDVVDVGRIEELGTEDHQAKLGFAIEDLRDTVRESLSNPVLMAH